MRLWTIQSIFAYERMLQTGMLTANNQRYFSNHNFLRAYAWMSMKMIESKIYPSSNGIEYPVWAWYQWEGKKKRLNVRKGGYAKRGDKMVQLTVEAEMKNVLLSDFDLFHYVLNYMYLPLDEKDDKIFEKEYESAGYSWSDLSNTLIENEVMLSLRDKIVKSWDRIFDLSKEDNGWLYGKLDNKTIQATLWQIRLEQVKKAEIFIAK